jgi:hypothetical protein
MIFSKRFWTTFVVLLLTAFFVELVLHFIPLPKGSPDPFPRWVEWPIAAALAGALVATYVQVIFESFVIAVAEEVVLRLGRSGWTRSE